MFTPELYLAKAAECSELARSSNSPAEVSEFLRRERSFTTLADNEQWLADHHNQTVLAADAGGFSEAASVLIGGKTPTMAQGNEACAADVQPRSQI